MPPFYSSGSIEASGTRNQDWFKGSEGSGTPRPRPKMRTVSPLRPELTSVAIATNLSPFYSTGPVEVSGIQSGASSKGSRNSCAQRCSRSPSRARTASHLRLEVAQRYECMYETWLASGDRMQTMHAAFLGSSGSSPTMKPLILPYVSQAPFGGSIATLVSI